MNNLRYIKTFAIITLCAVSLTAANVSFDKASAEPSAAAKPAVTASAQNYTAPLDIVNSPKSYLNKKVTMNARFDKFSTLGLDYKPAMKSSEEFISFLIKRDDTVHDIPLSEMKLFLKRDMAEKFIELKSNDKIKIVGTVFSDALGDAWINVESIVVTEKAPEKDGVK